jgi:hypothetical protein
MQEDSIFNDLGDSANFKKASIVKRLAYPCNKVTPTRQYPKNDTADYQDAPSFIRWSLQEIRRIAIRLARVRGP